MNFKKYIILAAVALGMSASFASCSDDDLDPTSIFEDTEELDPSSPTYQLDKFLDDSLRTPYNCAVTYRMKDVMTDKTYNLVPAKYANSVDLAVLCKYYWFDVYYNVVPDKDFLKKYGLASSTSLVRRLSTLPTVLRLLVWLRLVSRFRCIS